MLKPDKDDAWMAVLTLDCNTFLDLRYLKEHSQISTPDPIAHRGHCHQLLIAELARHPHWLKSLPENSSMEAGMSAFQAGRK
jgi:hypothetical protein